MKSSFKIILLSIGILFLSLSVSYATNETDPLSSESSYQIQRTSLDGLIYLLFVKGFLFIGKSTPFYYFFTILLLLLVLLLTIESIVNI